MAKHKLTKALLESTTATAKDIYFWDTALPRFGLRVTPSGSRIFLVQYRVRGAPGEGFATRRITIGEYGLWSAETAREEARKVLAKVDLGHDPFADRAKARLEVAAAARALAEAERKRCEETYQAVVDRFIASRKKQTRSWAETERLLTHDPLPVWGQVPVADIDRPQVAKLIDRIRERAPATARATYAALRVFFGWCVERGFLSSSPCDRLRPPPKMPPRDRVLSNGELEAIWRSTDQMPSPYGTLVKLLMLTGQRRAEVAEMAWGELDLEAGIWRIPGERTKNGRPHLVDLGPEVVALIKALPRSGKFVLPARDGIPIRGFSAMKRKLDSHLKTMGFSGSESWRLHDLRRTAATGMAELGSPPHVIERTLNHTTNTGGLVGVYQRHDYREERRKALLDWGARLVSIVEGAHSVR